MRTRNLSYVLMLFLALAFFSGGCATTPRGKVVQARELYTSTLAVLSKARAAGQIDDKTYAEIENYRKQTAAALTAMDVAAEAGNDVNFQTALKLYQDVIDKLLAAQIKVQRKE